MEAKRYYLIKFDAKIHPVGNSTQLKQLEINDFWKTSGHMHTEDTSDASSRSNISILTRDLNEIGTSMQIEADQSRRYTQYENYR